MLINTNQLISLMDLRAKAGDYIQKANSGMTFYVTDKGKLMATISPVSTVGAVVAFRKIDQIRKDVAKFKFTDNRDSTEVIREMRDSRYGD